MAFPSRNIPSVSSNMLIINRNMYLFSVSEVTKFATATPACSIEKIHPNAALAMITSITDAVARAVSPNALTT